MGINMKINNRRDFFKKVFIYTSAGAMLQVFAKNAAQAAELMLIDMTGKKRTDADNKESVGIATGMHYVDDLDKALKAKDAKLIRKAGEDCKSCMFYDYQKNGKSTCQLIPKVLVQPKGSCNTWVKKA